MRFFFKGIQTDNSIVLSSIDAADKNEAISSLTQKGIKVISIETKNTIKEASPVLQAFDKLFKKSKKEPGAITTKVLLVFFDKLYKMLSCGLTLSDSISSINKRTSNPTEKELTNRLLADISSGKPLSEAIQKFGTKIDNNVYSMILIGESSGNLSEVLLDVVNFLASKDDIKKKMISSIIYPTFLIAFTFIILLLASFVLMPKMETLIKDLGGELPTLTKSLMNGCDYALYLLPVIIVGVFVSTTILPKMRANPTIRYKTDKLMLKLPIFSITIPLFAKTSLTNLMSTLLSNGITTSEALELSESSINNRVLLERFNRAKTDILDGKSVCEAFESNEVLDGNACDLIEVGEKTGDIASSFKDVNKMYNEKLSSTLKKITLSMSSIAMILAFSIVGLLALGIVQAIMSVSSAASAS